MSANKSILKIKKEREDLYRFKNTRVINSRLPLIQKLIKNKTVLDIGSVQHSSSFEANPNFLFKFLTKHAKSVIGIDKSKKGVNKLKEKGYNNIVVGNAELIRFNQKFDVIMAGNVIEHLSNPGIFLNNMKKHLKERGRIIITTDNDGGFISFFHTLFLGYIPENPDHTIGFNYSRLRELISREGLKINQFYYYTFKDVPRKHSPSYILRTYSFFKTTLLKMFIFLRKGFSPGCILIITKKED